MNAIEGLKKYGEHDDGCTRSQERMKISIAVAHKPGVSLSTAVAEAHLARPPCDCGLDDLIKELEESEAKRITTVEELRKKYTYLYNKNLVEAEALDLAYLAGEDQKAQSLEALCFYADPLNYVGIAFLFDRPCGGFEEDFCLVYTDEMGVVEKPGKRARAALGIPEVLPEVEP